MAYDADVLAILTRIEENGRQQVGLLQLILKALEHPPVIGRSQTTN